ncbi:hypothetical protein [uncultured Muribaculum sp.]|uniref:hypothetical protein n=1 Tax=uncultured Muribaculum sp. TaxID=1918613 RepID=UPI0025A5B53F|nr:hypothetical protein [uncultured Muribaculum sp.]
MQGFKVDRILTPEQRAARELTRELELGCTVDSLRIDVDHYVIKFDAPDFFYGMKYEDLNFEEDYGIKLISVSRPAPRRNIIGVTNEVPMIVANLDADFRIEKGDVFTIMGTQRQFRDLFNHIK